MRKGVFVKLICPPGGPVAAETSSEVAKLLRELNDSVRSSTVFVKDVMQRIVGVAVCVKPSSASRGVVDRSVMVLAAANALRFWFDPTIVSRERK